MEYKDDPYMAELLKAFERLTWANLPNDTFIY